MGAKSRRSLFLPQPGITPGKGTINPLTLVIHLSKSPLPIDSASSASSHFSVPPNAGESTDHYVGGLTRVRPMFNPQHFPWLLEVSSPRLVGDLIVSGSLRLAAVCLSL